MRRRRHPGTRVLVRFGLAAAIGLAFATGAAAAPRWYQCTAWGGSHTGRYTFSIDAEGCSVFWKEIDRRLEIELCEAPVIVALKPFAPAAGYILRFNLETGGFSDHIPGWADRGSCRLTGKG